MRNLKFICVEDDHEFMSKLIQCVTLFFKEQGHRVIFDSYNDIPDNINLANVDACFFDIEVNDRTTLNLIKDIRNDGIVIPIIVVSQYKDYVFETVHMQIFDYIRKSKFNEEIIDTLLKLKNNIYDFDESIVVNYEGRLINVLLKDVLYIHIKSHHIIIHDIQGNEKEIWKDFDDVFTETSQLIKVHKSYVINIKHCKSVSKNGALLVNNVNVPISTRNQKEVEKQFILSHSLIK